MFATAGTLNAENGETFADHRYWGRLQLASPKLVITFGHFTLPRTQKCALSTWMSIRFSEGGVNHRVRIIPVDKLESVFPN